MRLAALEDAGWKTESAVSKVAEEVDVSVRTVYGARQKYLQTWKNRHDD
jgi:hypothetical protein